MSKCKYYRESENETYIPSCGVEDGVVENDVHPEDAMEWVYCPFCGGKIKLKNHKRHPGLFYGDEDDRKEREERNAKKQQTHPQQPTKGEKQIWYHLFYSGVYLEQARQL